MASTELPSLVRRLASGSCGPLSLGVADEDVGIYAAAGGAPTVIGRARSIHRLDEVGVLLLDGAAFDFLGGGDFAVVLVKFPGEEAKLVDVFDQRSALRHPGWSSPRRTAVGTAHAYTSCCDVCPNSADRGRTFHWAHTIFTGTRGATAYFETDDKIRPRGAGHMCARSDPRLASAENVHQHSCTSRSRVLGKCPRAS